MKSLDLFDFDLRECYSELEKFEVLLKQKNELREGKDIIPFFKKNLHLSAFIASYVPDIVKFDRIKHEFTIFGDFRADLVIGDSEKNTYCFIEFEDATKDSVFIRKKRITPDWSPRFEHGFSQIVDWFWKLDDFKNTGSFRDVFGSANIEYYGMLIIGRDSFLDHSDKTRLQWRLSKVVIDSRKIICLSFDQLARDIRHRLSLYRRIYEAESSIDDETNNQ